MHLLNIVIQLDNTELNFDSLFTKIGLRKKFFMRECHYGGSYNGVMHAFKDMHLITSYLQ